MPSVGGCLAYFSTVYGQIRLNWEKVAGIHGASFVRHKIVLQTRTKYLIAGVKPFGKDMHQVMSHDKLNKGCEFIAHYKPDKIVKCYY